MRTGTEIESKMEQKTACAPPLKARLAPWMEGLLSETTLLASWTEKFGSPLHLANTCEFRKNIASLVSPLKERGLNGSLFFARKANKLPCFVSVAAQEGIGVDTASLAELQETLALGLDGSKVVLTAIGKSAELIKTAAGAGVLVVLENEDELKLAVEISRTLACPMRIALRFSGFVLNGRKVFSRFGFDISDAANILETVSKEANLRLELLHAHLDRYDTNERTQAAGTLLELLNRAEELGMQPTGIDLGGGILICYLEFEKQWADFQNRLKEMVLSEAGSFTYGNDGLGYFKAGKELLGHADLYPAYNNCSKDQFVSKVLDNHYMGVPLFKLLKEKQRAVYFEPGRALLDGAGLSVARVTFRKRNSRDELLLGLAMNRMNLRPFRAEYCCDPIFIPIAAGEREEIEEGAFLVGNLCSESDTIYRRRLTLPHLPLPGDLVAFVNTAGYLAHHMEIGTHGDPLPKNLVVENSANGCFVKEVF